MQLEALEVLSPHQTAELLLLPLPVPPEKDDVINRVFDFLTESPEERKLPEVLLHLVNMSHQVRTPSLQTIVSMLDWTFKTFQQ